MEFQKKYASTSDKDLAPNKDKKIIGDDAFAIGDIIQELINKIEQTRSSLLR